jgi:uncharacterized protein (TIGR02145 family)
MNEIRIGNQIWMGENLRVTRFRNGDDIPLVLDRWEWDKAGEEGIPAFCYLNNDATAGEQFGNLYNWHAITDSRGLAPEGWRIPTPIDWMELIRWVGGEERAGLFLKSTSGWTEGNGLDKFNFKVLPGGMRGGDGFFSGEGLETDFWLNVDSNPTVVSLTGDSLETTIYGQCFKGNGHYVRCVKDL